MHVCIYVCVNLLLVITLTMNLFVCIFFIFTVNEVIYFSIYTIEKKIQNKKYEKLNRFGHQMEF